MSAVVLGLIALVVSACSGTGAPAGATCSSPSSSVAGVTLDNFLGDRCVQGPVNRWDEPCGGSIIVSQTTLDNVIYLLFDPKTKMLQAVSSELASGPGTCTYGILGFQLPTACFDGTSRPSATNLCVTENSDAGPETDAGRDASVGA
jgi:hypothetical protein